MLHDKRSKTSERKVLSYVLKTLSFKMNQASLVGFVKARSGPWGNLFPVHEHASSQIFSILPATPFRTNKPSLKEVSCVAFFLF